MTSGEGVAPEVTPVQATSSPMCAAILLRRRLAMEQEAATIAEAITGERVRAPQPSDMPTLACKACKDRVSFTYDAQLDAPSCTNVNSGSCEGIWIALHPDEYKADDGILAVKSLFCGRCPANLELTRQPDGQIEAKVSDSTCGVDEAGERFRKLEMANANRAVPSLEEMQRQKATRERQEKEYKARQAREADELQRAWAEAHPEEAAQEAAAIQSVLQQETQGAHNENNENNENDSGDSEENEAEEDEAWEQYDGDPNADLDVAAMQDSEEERTAGEPHSPKKHYPIYKNAYYRRTDPRWKWLVSQSPTTAQTGNDAVGPDK